MPRLSITITMASSLAAPVVLACATAVAAAVGCSHAPPTTATSPDAAAPDDASTPPPFQADVPAVYVAKVKNVLVGLPPTDDEVRAAEADPTKLASLVDAWMALPEYATKMGVFFQLAFQQTQITVADLADQTYPRAAIPNAYSAPVVTQNVRESFARTALALVAEGRPFTETMTTERFMMTPALMELYAFLDAYGVDDAGKVTDHFRAKNPALTITVEAAQGPIPIAETLDPSSPNYMHWYDPDVAKSQPTDPAGCEVDPIVYPPNAIALHYVLVGSLDNRKNPNGTGAPCLQRGGTALAPQLQGTDYTAWKMVTIRPPKPGESVTPFYDLPTLRSATELVLATPRVGFFSTPAFFANWQTNTSNQMRVTTNQLLIVALGAAIDGTDSTKPPSTPGLDATHAATPDCVGCHQTLDPTRSLMASAFSWNYHVQTDAALVAQKGLFAFHGVIASPSTPADLGATLAAHPLFGPAWAQKLCYYVNSEACAPDDPELARVVGVFQSSGWSWNALVKELVTSPLTTNTTATKTTSAAGEVVAVSRRDHLCAALDARLGFTDVCGRDVLAKGGQSTIPAIVAGLPSDGYGRGAVAPVLPNQPTLFFRAGVENICADVAALVVDPAKPTAGVKTWSSSQADAAIGDFVQIIMALTPSDPRAQPAQALLASHFADAKKTGASATDALRSTFVVACLAPSSVSIGL